MTPSPRPSPQGEREQRRPFGSAAERCPSFFSISPRGEGWGEWGYLTVICAALALASSAATAGDIRLKSYVVAGDAIPTPLGGLKGDPSRGRAIVFDRRNGNCLICHRFPLTDEPFQGEIGPSLVGVGLRLSEGQIRLRLADESTINPATLMPPYYRTANLVNVAPEYAGKPALTAQELEDVVAYLSSLKE